jgi:hypothetical protein
MRPGSTGRERVARCWHLWTAQFPEGRHLNIIRAKSAMAPRREPCDMPCAPSSISTYSGPRLARAHPDLETSPSKGCCSVRRTLIELGEERPHWHLHRLAFSSQAAFTFHLSCALSMVEIVVRNSSSSLLVSGRVHLSPFVPYPWLKSGFKNTKLFNEIGTIGRRPT